MALSKIGTNQPVLVILCHPADKSPSEFGGLGAAAQRQLQIDVYENLVNPAIMQMSYGRTSFDFDFTDWIELPQDDSFYFDRPAGGGENLLENPLYDALPAASFAGFDPNGYEAAIVCMATEHIRGYARAIDAGIYAPTVLGPPIWIMARKHVNVVSTNAHWGRRAHEIGHHLGMPDIYNKNATVSDGRQWDLGGDSGSLPLFCAHNMITKEWFTEANIRELQWSEDDLDETVTVRAHDLTEDTDPDVVHAIKIDVFPGLIYYVEVRQRPLTWAAELDMSGDDERGSTAFERLRSAADHASANPSQQLFDHDIPVEDTVGGGVVVLKVVYDEAQAPLNQPIRRITRLADKALQAGESVVDAARRIEIAVDSQVGTNPLAYRITVKWSEVATADPAGRFNLRVRPWDSSWQTPDVWIDSELNEWDTYDDPLAADNTPIGNGDRPQVGDWNRLYARVHNDAPVGAAPGQGITANDVQVTFYVNSPPAIGDRGTWIPHAVKTIPSIAAGSFEDVRCLWAPAVGEHTCVKVVAASQTGEYEVADNGAQENVFRFDTAGASPHQPIVQTVSVQNPLPEPALIHIGVRGLAVGWEATVEHEWLFLPALGEHRMRVALMTDVGRDRPLASYPSDDLRRKEIQPEVRVMIDGGIYRWLGDGPNVDGSAEHLQPIGGIQIHARARKAVDIDLDVDDGSVGAGRLTLIGQVQPAYADVTVHVKIRDSRDATEIVHLVTAKDGSFRHTIARAKADPGSFTAQAFISADAVVADTVSDTLVVDSPERWYRRPQAQLRVGG